MSTIAACQTSRHVGAVLTASLLAEVDQEIEALVPELVAFAQTLISLPSPPGHEQDAQRAIATKYAALGLTTNIIPSLREEIADHPAFTDDGIPFNDRLNVVARWSGSGGGRSLILNGHMDVVPPGDTALWSRDPWDPHVDGDRLFGRGSCDMKAGLACAVIAVQALRSLGVTLRGDVVLESVIGEESGGVGTLTTIRHGYRADACIIMEPMDLRICVAHAGSLTFRLIVHGRGAHGSMKSEGVNAIEEFLPIFEALEQLNVERHRRFHDALFDHPNNIAPISVGIVRAGEWPSSVPSTLVAEGRYGTFPNESLGDARAEFCAAVAAAAARRPWLVKHPPIVQWFEGVFEPGRTPNDSPIVLSLAACHEAVTASAASIFGIPSGADMRLFTLHAGIPTVMYGPGSLSQAHTSDEFVRISEMVTCTKVLARTLIEWCGVQEEGT